MNPEEPLPHQIRRVRRIVFSRPLQKTAITKEINVDDKKRLRLSGDAAARDDIAIIIRYKNMDYPMVCRSRKKGKYDKSVLSNGWLALVRATSLKEGDHVMLFEPEEYHQEDGAADQGRVYVMEVSRAGHGHQSKYSTQKHDMTSKIVDSMLVSAPERSLELQSDPSLAAVEDLMFNSSSAGTTKMIDLNSVDITAAEILLDLNSAPSVDQMLESDNF